MKRVWMSAIVLLAASAAVMAADESTEALLGQCHPGERVDTTAVVANDLARKGPAPEVTPQSCIACPETETCAEQGCGPKDLCIEGDTQSRCCYEGPYQFLCPQGQTVHFEYCNCLGYCSGDGYAQHWWCE